MELDKEEVLHAISSLYQKMVDSESIVKFDISTVVETAYTDSNGLSRTGYNRINIQLVMK